MSKRDAGQTGPVTTVMLVLALGVGSVFVMSGVAQVRRNLSAPKIISSEGVQSTEAREMREMLKGIESDLQKTRKLVETIDGRPIVGSDWVLATDCTLASFREDPNPNELHPLIQLTAPLFAEEYRARVAQQHPERILQPSNLVEARQRTASRVTLNHLGKELADYRKFLLKKFEDARKDAADPASRWRNPIYTWRVQEGFERSIKFYRLQFGLEAEVLDEMEAMLDLIDQSREVKLDGDTIAFPTQGEQEDYDRSLSRIRRLEALHAKRDSDLRQRLERKPENTHIMQDGAPSPQPAGSWAFLLDSGARVELDEKQIAINGKVIVLPIEKAKLIAALGEPREIVGESVACIWDELGIEAVHPSGATQFSSLMIALNLRKDQQWPRQVVRGRLMLLGIAVDEHWTPGSLNRKFCEHQFVADEAGKVWKLELEGYTVKAEFKLDGTIDSLLIQAKN